MKRTLAAVCAALALTMTITAGASAATLSDLTALGYTVVIDWTVPGPNGTICTVYTFAGYGISTMANSCDDGFQATVDSIADPIAHCNRKWQYLHPEQVDPWTHVAQLGWTETADKCADVFTVTNPNDQSVRYNGPGAGLVALAAVIGAPPVPAPPPPPASVVPPAAPPAPPAPTPAAPAAPQPAPQQPAPAPSPAAPPSASTPVASDPAPPPPATPVAPTITLTADQLAQIIADAVAKALRETRKATPAKHRLVHRVAAPDHFSRRDREGPLRRG